MPIHQQTPEEADETFPEADDYQHLEVDSCPGLEAVVVENSIVAVDLHCSNSPRSLHCSNGALETEGRLLKAGRCLRVAGAQNFQVEEAVEGTVQVRFRLLERPEEVEIVRIPT